MHITLEEGHTADELRRKLRRDGGARYRITVRHGKIYTIKYNPGRQPRTVFQRNAQDTLVHATRLASRDMRDEAAKYRWQKRARKLGYKSAYGAAKAYYVKTLKKRELKKVEKKWETVEKAAEAKVADYTELVRNVVVLNGVLRVWEENKRGKDQVGYEEREGGGNTKERMYI